MIYMTCVSGSLVNQVLKNSISNFFVLKETEWSWTEKKLRNTQVSFKNTLSTTSHIRPKILNIT